MCAIASEPSEASAVRRREGPLPEKPLFTVELVIFTIRADRLHVLLVERADQPRKGWWALPGGVLDPRRDDSIEACALRKLAEEAGVHPPYLEQLKTYGSRDRDPRGWTATTVYFALMASERVQLGGNQAAGWVAVQGDGVGFDLALDHARILADAVERATGLRPGLPARMADLFDRSERVTPVPNDLAALEALIKERRRN